MKIVKPMLVRAATQVGALVLVAILLVQISSAQHVDIAVYQQNTQITLHNGSSPAQNETQVFRNDFDFWGPPFNIFAGDDPGLQMSGTSAPAGYAALPGSTQLSVEVVPIHIPGQAIGNVAFWDSVSAEPEFVTLPLGHDFYLEDAASTEVLLAGDLERFDGLIAGVTDGTGGLHEHMTFAVENGGGTPVSGVYLMGWHLSMAGLDDSKLAFVALTTPSLPSSVKSGVTAWLESQVDTIRMVGDFDNNGRYELDDIDAARRGSGVDLD